MSERANEAARAAQEAAPASGHGGATGHGGGHGEEHEEASRPGAPTLGDRIYLVEILKGLVNTLRHLLFTKPFTTQYPEEQLPYNPRARGEHILKVDEQGREKCVACLLCEAACPAKCIRIVPGPSPWPDRERYPVEFEINMLRCIYCAFCECACPCDAIELTPKLYVPRYDREGFLYNKEKLKANYPQDWRERFGKGFGKKTGAPYTGRAPVQSLIGDIAMPPQTVLEGAERTEGEGAR